MSERTDRRTTTQRVQFRGAEGQTLAGLLEVPADPPRLFAVAAHCFTCSKDFPAITHVSRGLARRGIAVLRFDFTGLGTSEGRFEETNFSSAVADVEAAAGYLESMGSSPSLLVGHSFGGAASLRAASQVTSVRAVATIAAPSSPAHVLDHFPREVEAALAAGSAPIAIGGRSYALTRQFIEDVRGSDFEDELSKLDRSLLVLHAPDDQVVAIRHAERIYRATRGPRSFVSLPGADHVLSDRNDADYAASIISAWVARYA